MGNTPRPHKLAVPMLTRNTDISMLNRCPASWILDLFFEHDQMDASYFVVGSACHLAFESVAVQDFDFDQATTVSWQYISDARQRWEDEETAVIETANRSLDGMEEDAVRIIGKWFQDVHPDSDKRFPIYDEFEWPFKSEVPIYRTAEDAGTKYDIWGSMDAVFTPKGIGAKTALVDWKTGATPKSDPDQLYFYLYTADRNRDTRLWFHHADGLKHHGKIQHADHYPGDEAVRTRIQAAEWQKDSEFWPANAGWYCTYCAVQEHCPLIGDEQQEDLTRMLQWRTPMTQPYQKESD